MSDPTQIEAIKEALRESKKSEIARLSHIRDVLSAATERPSEIATDWKEFLIKEFIDPNIALLRAEKPVCKTCAGIGECLPCEGSGIANDAGCGSDVDASCKHCKGTGKCPDCNPEKANC